MPPGFCEDLIPLEGQTTGEVSFTKIVAFFEENNSNLLNMLVTGGAPSMIGRDQALPARMGAAAPRMRSLHCLIHQSLLCATLRGDLKEAMDSLSVAPPVYSIAFFRLLTDMSAEYRDLLLHNDTRWLSDGNALKRGSMSSARRNFHTQGLFVLTMFGSTCTCESSFPHTNAIKTHNIPH